jgi:hypothetical protein
MITMKRKIVEGITVKTVRPVEGIYEQCSDILLNWRDIRIKFGYKMLSEIGGKSKKFIRTYR